MTNGVAGYMAGDLSGYFELAAQVIPVLLLALVIESGFLPKMRAEAAALRTPRSFTLSVTPTDFTLSNPAGPPVHPVMLEALVKSARNDFPEGIDHQVWTYVVPKVRPFLAVLAIEATLIGAVLCEVISLACVAFDVPRRWEEILGIVVLLGLTALLSLTLLALRKLTVTRIKTVKVNDPDNAEA
jgi:hypothetical protein